METLMKEINDILESKNTEIEILKWQVEKLTKENEELKIDIEMYKENEVNKYE